MEPCPKCKGDDIRYDNGQMVCFKCGNKGPMAGHCKDSEDTRMVAEYNWDAYARATNASKIISQTRRQRTQKEDKPITIIPVRRWKCLNEKCKWTGAAADLQTSDFGGKICPKCGSRVEFGELK